MISLVKNCKECPLSECIQCEHSWSDVQEIEKLEDDYNRLCNERDSIIETLCERIRKEIKQLELNIDNDPSLISNEYKLELKQKSIYKNIYKILDKIEKEKANEV